MSENNVRYLRNVTIISLILIAIITSNCEKETVKYAPDNSGLKPLDSGIAVISFKEYEHDFGYVIRGEKVSYVFTFKNEGTGNLVMEFCGCTDKFITLKYDDLLIPSGEIGNLEIIFDSSGRSGIQTEIITVVSNASTPGVIIKITAEVISNNN